MEIKMTIGNSVLCFERGERKITKTMKEAKQEGKAIEGGSAITLNGKIISPFGIVEEMKD